LSRPELSRFGSGEAGVKDCFYGLVGSLVGGGDGEVGEAAVEGMALGEAELGGDGIG
jgi:hypothetical protein